jgi:hypothetical protein
MNARKSILLSAIAVALAVPGLSFATSLYHAGNGEVGDTFHPDHIKSSKTRADVLQELDAARKDGSLQVLENEYPVLVTTPAPGKTRAQVQQEFSNMSAEEKASQRKLYTGG